MSDNPPKTHAQINLTFPVKEAGVDLTALSMRRPKVRDQLAMEANSKQSAAEKEVSLFSNLCEVAPATIKELDMTDYKKLQDQYDAFLKPQE